MEIRQLEYFLAVVDHGGVTRAAQALHISQPSLSQAIRSLERELQVSLFHRVGRGLVLSPSGEALVGPARHAIRSIEQASDLMQRLQRLEGGRVDICALPSVGTEPLAAWVGYLRRLHPAVAVRIEESDDLAGVIESVRSGGTELGFVTLPAALTGLRCRTLSTQYVVLVCPPGWSGTAAAPIPLEAVGDIPLIVDGRHTAGWSQIEQVLLEHSVDVVVAAEVRHPSSALHLVLSGAGAAFMPLRLALLAYRRGAVIRPTDPPILRQIAVIHRPEPLSAAAQALLDLAIKDAARWVAANERHRAGGLGYVEAALAVDNAIWAARRSASAPDYAR
ncbi:MAG TPA: LysR family transcriptional regulator [Streptosporangiaceae bacterium]|nr:LysR family transcriptional regulator [Streptosporangiaceae bacterium]